MGKTARGFTLIEMAIVLVIIGLIVGGVLVGQSLIGAAAIRAQVSQIEKYQTAVNTFREKYGYLPGDITSSYAANFGLVARGPHPGQGDGNGVIEGWNNTINTPVVQSGGETALFWVDLSTTHLIDGGFNTATVWQVGTVASSTIPSYFPLAKVGGGNFIKVYSGGYKSGDGVNYFDLSIVNSISLSYPMCAPGLTVQAAESIDAKVDDGLPQSGNVTAMYLNWQAPWGPPNTVHWASGAVGVSDGANSGSPNYGPSTAATAGSSTTCYDNGGIGGLTQQYSVEISGGSNVNCALSFRFQ